VTVHNTTDVHYDPYDVEINADPHPVFRRLRDEALLYYNEQHGFYAVSRYDDVERGLADKDHFSNARSDVLEFIKAGVRFPSGIFIFEDPPLHTMHAG
jgi:cytochrome P450